MAESQKAATSSVKPKEKTSVLELDFGKDFLSSWKDDGMDFDFGSTPKSKKKTFDFGKADMDFNLDADFDKLSSFKIDMSDLDISTPPRKAGKQKERREEVSPSGSHQKKKDNFSFSFDFNEFDNLNFEPTLKKGSDMSNKSKNKEVSSSQSGSGRSGANLAGDIVPMEDDISSKLPDTQAVNTSKIDTEGDSFKAVHTRNEDGCFKSVTKDSCPPVPANSGEEVAIERARASPEKTVSAVLLEKEEANQQPEKISPPESHRQEIFQDLSAQSIADIASTQDTASDLQEEVGIPVNVNSSTSGEWNVSEKLIACPDSTNRNSGDESLPSESLTNSPRKNGDGSKFTGVNDVTITTDGTEFTRRDSEFEHLSATIGSNKLFQRAMANGRNQDSTSMLHVAPLKSETTNNDLVSDIEKRTGVIQSIDFKKPNESESQLQQASLSRTKMTFIDSKRISSTQVNPPDERRETDLKATQSGISLAGISSQPRKLRGDPVQTGNAEGEKGINSTRECPNDDRIESVIKVMGNSRTQDQDVSKDGLVLIRSEKNIEDRNALSSHLHPSSSNEQANKSTSKSSINLRLPVSSITSMKNTKNPFLEKIKKSPNQAGRTTTELPSLKSLSTAGGKLEAISSSLLKGIKSMRNAEQSMELQDTIGSKMVHSAETKKQTPPMLTLKRKAFEDSNADKLTFTPFKRLSPSPSESRNAREPSDRLVNNTQVCNHENMANDNARNTLQDCQKPTLDKPPEVSLTELETSLSIESDNNVEKAEACSKELEYICNMLKKKHDEAKEILVRAIVNNNNLLMLNHPMHQEKISFQPFLLLLLVLTCTAIFNYVCKSFTIEYIRMVQKFASLLISK